MILYNGIYALVQFASTYCLVWNLRAQSVSVDVPDLVLKVVTTQPQRYLKPSERSSQKLRVILRFAYEAFHLMLLAALYAFLCILATNAKALSK